MDGIWDLLERRLDFASFVPTPGREVAARIRASEEERARFAKVPFFSGLGPAELSRLSVALVVRRVPAEEYVFRVGEPGDRGRGPQGRSGPHAAFLISPITRSTACLASPNSIPVFGSR